MGVYIQSSMRKGRDNKDSSNSNTNSPNITKNKPQAGMEKTPPMRRKMHTYENTIAVMQKSASGESDSGSGSGDGVLFFADSSPTVEENHPHQDPASKISSMSSSSLISGNSADKRTDSNNALYSPSEFNSQNDRYAAEPMTIDVLESLRINTDVGVVPMLASTPVHTPFAKKSNGSGERKGGGGRSGSGYSHSSPERLSAMMERCSIQGGDDDNDASVSC